VTLLVFLAQLVAGLEATAVYLAQHGRVPPLPIPVDLGFLGVVDAVVLIAFGGLSALVGPLAWPEAWGLGLGAASAAQHYLGSYSGARHCGVLLPMAPRRVWTQRLAWVLIVSVLLSLTGLLAGTATRCLGPALGLLPVVGWGPWIYVAYALAPVVAVWAFALAPLVGMAQKVVGLGVHFVVAAIFGGSLCLGIAHWVFQRTLAGQSDPSTSTAWVAACGVAVVIESWLLCAPAAWPLRPDGRRSVRTTAQCILVLLSVCVTMVLFVGVEGALIERLVGVPPPRG
jgi:hypothetical protein